MCHTPCLAYCRGKIWFSLPDSSVVRLGAVSVQLDDHIAMICADIAVNLVLYHCSDSIVAMNVTNGKMLWFFQSTPHDLFDFDCGWNVVLGNAFVDGQNRSVVFKGCKNGYLYALDASTGSLLWYFNPPSVKRVG